MRNLRYFATVIFTLMIVHMLAPTARAHPLGNFTINHYAGLHVRSDAITIDYVLDMAEIPAFQEIDLIDADGNGRADPEESAGYHPAQCTYISASLDLRVNDQRLALKRVSSAIEYPPGQGGLLTLRLTCAFEASIPSGMSAMHVEFEDQSYHTRLGWREIVVTGQGVSLYGEFSTGSLSHRLTNYPQDLLSSPLDQRQVSFQTVPPSSLSQEKRAAADSGPQPGTDDKEDAFTRLILLENITLPTLLLAMVVSFLWGAMHAMTPGHGKTIVGAYLVGARGTAKHALFLGVTTTITHTTGVFVLGLVTLFAAQFILPEKLFPWLSLVSGLLIVGIGTNLFFIRLRDSGLLARPAAVKPEAHHHPSPDAHEHGHDHPHLASHHHAHIPEHPLDGKDDKGHTGHSHMPPGVDGSPLTWRSLLALGISGGLLPCPSALVVLLSAIALNRVGFGLVLVFAFSLGLAGVLSGIGLLFIYAGRFLNRIPAQNRLLRLLPTLSALFVTLAGLGITGRALIESGFIKL